MAHDIAILTGAAVYCVVFVFWCVISDRFSQKLYVFLVICGRPVEKFWLHTACQPLTHDVFQAALCAAGPASARITSRITLRCRPSHSDFQIDLLLASLARLVLSR